MGFLKLKNDNLFCFNLRGGGDCPYQKRKVRFRIAYVPRVVRAVIIFGKNGEEPWRWSQAEKGQSRGVDGRRLGSSQQELQGLLLPLISASYQI